MRVRWILAGWLVGLAVGAAAPARAEGEDDLEKLRKQVEKVLDLMKENEKALLALSTGEAASPTNPAVPPSQGVRATSSRIPRELAEVARLWPT